jgi:hypothetical protein
MSTSLGGKKSVGYKAEVPPCTGRQKLNDPFASFHTHGLDFLAFTGFSLTKLPHLSVPPPVKPQKTQK